jgi:hypothetical protein
VASEGVGLRLVSHEFRDFSGLTLPGACEAARTPFRNHFVSYNPPTREFVENQPMADNMETYRTLTPYLVVPDADAEMRFLKTAFGARETPCQRSPDLEILE